MEEQEKTSISTQVQNEFVIDDGRIESIEEYLSPEELFDDLISRVKKYNPEGVELIRKAFELANNAHKDQLRKSGEPYLIHPMAVAEILADLGMDEETIVAGLLHDVVEDTDYTLQDLSEMGFPQTVIDALALMTHDKSVSYMDYVAKIKTNSIARAVKLVDLKHNSDLSRLDVVDHKAICRVQKYKKAIELLEE